MRLIEKADGVLEYELDLNDSAQDKNFYIQLKNYKLQRQGATVVIYEKEGRSNKIVGFFKPFDNTFLICDYAQKSFDFAAFFGTKRFLVGEGRRAITCYPPVNTQAFSFKRDRSFNFSSTRIVNEKYKVVDLQKILALRDHEQLCDELAELFNRCADFTPGKQEEYLAGGNKADKFCRFNLENNLKEQLAQTQHIFLLDEKNKIVGTMSATLLLNERMQSYTIYLYDEVVDYFTLLTLTEQEIVHAKANELRNLEAQLKEEKDKDKTVQLEKNQADLKADIRKLVEPKRKELLNELFEATRRDILAPSIEWKKLEDMKSVQTVFIRVAAGRESMYEELGCAEEFTNPNSAYHYVIHGPATVYTKMLDAHIKTWAQKELMSLTPPINLTQVGATIFAQPYHPVAIDRPILFKFGKTNS